MLNSWIANGFSAFHAVPAHIDFDDLYSLSHSLIVAEKCPNLHEADQRLNKKK